MMKTYNETGTQGYAIIPFGDYYGVYHWSDEIPYRANYLTTSGKLSIGSGLASAIGLPEEAMFNSIEEAKTCIALIAGKEMEYEEE